MRKTAHFFGIIAAIVGSPCLAQDPPASNPTALLQIHSASGAAGQILATVADSDGKVLTNLVARLGGQDFQISDVSNFVVVSGICHPFAPQFPVPRMTGGASLPHQPIVAIDARLVARLVPTSNVMKTITCKAN